MAGGVGVLVVAVVVHVVAQVVLVVHLYAHALLQRTANKKSFESVRSPSSYRRITKAMERDCSRYINDNQTRLAKKKTKKKTSRYALQGFKVVLSSRNDNKKDLMEHLKDLMEWAVTPNGGHDPPVPRPRREPIESE